MGVLNFMRKPFSIVLNPCRDREGEWRGSNAFPGFRPVKGKSFS